MRATKAIEDCFLGVSLIAESLLAISVVVLTGLLIVTGVLMEQADKLCSTLPGCYGLV